MASENKKRNIKYTETCGYYHGRQRPMGDRPRVAAHLGIPFLTFDLEEAYKKGVAEYLIREYAAGRTPNPDVMCNKEVKFGAFLARALEAGADYVATGHYARVFVDLKTKTAHFSEGVDPAKDQSYFLWTLGQHELSHTLFPLGSMKKTEVRKLAQKFGLPNAERKDSQGVCFIGQLDMKEFLKRFIKIKRGDVIDELGVVIGEHEGVELYTLGERHGFTITKKTPHDHPYYIVRKNIEVNTITVTHEVSTEEGTHTEYVLDEVNWTGGTPVTSEKIEARIRYHGDRIPVTVRTQENTTIVVFAEPLRVASGQSVVLYRGTECIGGGVVR